MHSGAYEILALIMRYWFLLLIGFAVFMLVLSLNREARIERALVRQIGRAGETLALLLVSDARGQIEPGMRYPLSGDLLLGKGRRCDIPLKNADLATQHVLLSVHAGRLLLSPIGSALVAINGEAVEKPETAVPGDRIQLGGLLFELQEETPPPAEKIRVRDIRKEHRRLKMPNSDWILLAMAVFEFSAFVLLAFYKEFSPLSMALAAGMPILLVAQALGLRRIFPHMDQNLLIIGNFLCAIGLILLVRLSPERAQKQAVFYLIGIAAMLVATFMVAKLPSLKFLRWPAMILSVGLLGLTLLIGRETYGAKNWLDFGLLSLQPSEFVKIGLILVLAMYLSERRTLPSLIPAGAFAAVCLLLICLQKDLGAVVICFFICLFMYYAATGNLGVSLVALAGAAAGAVVLYFLFDHVQLRVAMWQNPWRSPQSGGYQIIQALVAIGSGGMFGLGLGLGSPTTIPVYDTDFIFAALCEEMGMLVGLLTLMLYVLLFLRAGNLALKSKSGFDSLLCVGVLSSLAIQTFLIVGGVIKMIPLTGVTLPFVSYGGSSLLSSMIMLGILQGVSVRANKQEEQDFIRAQALREIQP